MSASLICRIAVLVIGVATIGLGLHSHFQSAWVKSLINVPLLGEIKPYQICENKFVDQTKCPPIAYERLYISVILICFLISLVGFILSLLCNMSSGPIKCLDVIYNVVASIVLLAAAALYILSAVQIEDKTKLFDRTTDNFRYKEKLAAGGLTILQGVLCFISAIVFAKA